MEVASDIPHEAYEGPPTAPSPLRLYRIALGLTQAELAERAGINRITVSALERRENVPQLATARRLAAVLGVPLAELFPESDNGDPAQAAEVKTPAEAGRHGQG